jgi:hypothetical protein
VAEEESDNASNDDAESKKDESKKEKKKKRAPSPHWSSKVLRTFIFATLGTFLAAYIFGNPIPNGLRVDFDLIASIKLGLIAGVLSAILRALAAMLPIFSDD